MDYRKLNSGLGQVKWMKWRSGEVVEKPCIYFQFVTGGRAKTSRRENGVAANRPPISLGSIYIARIELVHGEFAVPMP